MLVVDRYAELVRMEGKKRRSDDVWVKCSQGFEGGPDLYG